MDRAAGQWSALADQVTAGLVGLLSQHTDLGLRRSDDGIVSVLVFGAGTDYALLLIARYREELRQRRRPAGRDAVALAARCAGRSWPRA